MEELGRRYPHLRPSAYLPDFKSPPECATPTPMSVRNAQKVIGELTWIAGRTRPDVSFCVNKMSRMTTTAPEYAKSCGEQVIRFLLGSAKLKLMPCSRYA